METILSLNEVLDTPTFYGVNNQNILLGKPIIADTELLTFAQCLFKIIDCSLGARYLYLIATCHDPHIGMLVLETEDILVIHAVKGRRIEGIVER